ncbi:hypothetical protein [Klebsiella phage UPM 2146]|uniref:Uncharacterized protein n=1 Tax=Klebsiella phage UPM 2146 TaxID=2847816 RepID=A0A5Q2F259_9CAUD|nr:hypothetical protein HYQ02_gp206 [Klebsiella phage UPM 2146]QGF20653.1 hypothetical protein [Klebsiella phage UPM 2146]
MNINCVFVKDEIPLEKQDDFLKLFLERISLEFSDVMITAEWGDDETAVVSEDCSDYVKANYQRFVDGLKQDLIIFDYF